MLQVFRFPYGLDVPRRLGRAWGLVDSAGLRVANPTLQSAVRASRVLTFAAQPADGDTVTVARRDGSTVVYRCKDDPAQVNDYERGADADEALTNLSHAIAGTGTPGTNYFLGTEPALDWDVTLDTGANTITLTAINYGDAYNAAVAAFAESGANHSWGAATDGVDTPDYKIAPSFGTQANASAAPVARNGVFVIAPTGDQLLEVQHVEFDDDSGGGDFIRDDLIYVPTDHPKAAEPNGCLYAGKIADPDNDITAAFIDIPANTTHASGSDWAGNTDTLPPEVDQSIRNYWIELFNPYTGISWAGAIKDYDANGGAAANEGRVTLLVDNQIPTTVLGRLQTGGTIFYRIWQHSPTRTADLGIQAKADFNAEADTAISDFFPTLDEAALQQVVDDLENGGRLDLLIDAIKAITDQLGAAQSELAAMPAANATPLEKLNFVFTFLRNKRTNDGSVEQLFKDDAATVLGEAAISEAGGTVTKGEMAAP